MGTNTEVGIVSFAASSSLEAGYTSVLGGPSAALTNAINNVYNNTGGGTNWDAGLFAVNAPFITAPDLVVMVTDGNPTLNNTTNTSASEVNWEDFTQAVTSANLLKSNDSRVITVAAGAAGSISIPGLVGISGPLTSQPSALDDDYIIGTPAELADALRDLALARCGASLDIEKQSVGGTATFDFSGNGAGLPATFTRDTAAANPTANAPVRVHRSPVRHEVRPGDARGRLDAHEHRLHGQRRGDHHRHRQRRGLRPGRYRRLRSGRHHRAGGHRRQRRPDLHVHE